MKMKGIEYSDKRWNVITGCFGIENGTCAVGTDCWAYKMSFRQAGRNGYPAKPNQFKPTFHADKLCDPINRNKPTIYNTCFMGDIGYAEKDWLEMVISIINQCPQHRFIFLTKVPNELMMLNLQFPDNCIIGVTVNSEADIWRISELVHHIDAKYKWVSFEPIYEDMDIDLDGIDWCVIGAQTNPELQPETDWVRSILRETGKHKIPIFMKPNLKGTNHIQELPEMLRKES